MDFFQTYRAIQEGLDPAVKMTENDSSKVSGVKIFLMYLDEPARIRG